MICSRGSQRSKAPPEASPPPHALSVESARELEDELFGATRTTEVAYTRDIEIEGPHGPVPMRAVRPTVDGTLPMVVVYHGGLWALGSLDSIEDSCREIATRTPAVVLAVDYRLAPEHPFPTGLDDCIAAYAWARENAVAFGGDRTRVSVAGTSAGANLATGVARFCRDGEIPTPDRQTLLYPMVDDDFSRDSYAENESGPLLSRDAVERFWERYLRSSVDRANPYVAPLRGDQAGLPTTTVVTAGHDPLRDEGIAYAEAMADEGVDVTHHHRPSMCHGFLSLTGEVKVADESMDAVIGGFREH
ncbi:alpha/beta hydrolase [Halobacteriales archaeon QH_7_65_31]|nr:MAG: alpha/beta hydrolase [Halobacteriales archaeon QH_7_65_31]